MSCPDEALNSLATLQNLVSDCRARLAGDLCELIDELGPTLIHEARELANASRDEPQRRFFLSLRSDLQSNWIRITPAFRTALARRSKAAAELMGRSCQDAQSHSSLHILSDEEAALQVGLREVVDRVNIACSEETYALERRISQLTQRGALSPDDSWFRVEWVCGSFDTACASVIPDSERRVPLLRLIGGHLAEELPQFFRSINETLIDADILPRLKRSYRDSGTVGDVAAAADAVRIMGTIERLAKTRASAHRAGSSSGSFRSSEFIDSLRTFQQVPVNPSSETSGDAADGNFTNVVRLARDSEAARHVRPVEAVTLDIVSALFDLVFSDKNVSEGIKTLVSRLQMPVLKVAMLNQQFFADRSHPARRFLNSISGIAIRWGKHVNVNDPFYCKLLELVERIQSTYDGDVSVFDAAILDLGNFIAERDAIEAEASRALADAVREREDEIRIQRKGQAHAQQIAEKSLAPILTLDTPLAIGQFLRGYWRDVLQARIFSFGIDGTPFAEALQSASDLVWSVAPKQTEQERQRQMTILRPLLKSLNAGLDEIGIADEARRAFMDTLVELQLNALRAKPREQRKAHRKTTLATAPAVHTIGPATLQVSHATSSGVRFQDISLPGEVALDGENAPDRTNLRRARQLVRGDWVDFIAPGQTQRERLTWINSSRSLLLFSNHAAECAISITPEALALRLKNQTAQIVKRDTPMFERALNGAVKAIDNSAKN